MSEEYISRKSVRDAIAALSIERFELTPAYRLYVEALDNVDKRVVKIPAVDVKPVVLCADCKWFQINMRQDGYLPKGVPECECRHWCGPCDPTDFCSYGARMDGDENV